MLKQYRKENWIDLETGKVFSFREMLAEISNNFDIYGIDEWTPESEVFEYFLPESLFY